jgi:hypothetical protein
LAVSRSSFSDLVRSCRIRQDRLGRPRWRGASKALLKLRRLLGQMQAAVHIEHDARDKTVAN